jgi:NitT/TauT family transport system substrate-binding protein
LAIAGGPLDKSWLMLRAFAKRSQIDLVSEAWIQFGAPALLYAKTRQGEADANLNYWNFCVALEVNGFKPLIEMRDVEKALGAQGPVAMVGYVFDENFAKEHRGALRNFFAIAHEAKEILTYSDEDWRRLAPLIGSKDETQNTLYRRAYVEGIPRRTVEDEAKDAAALYRILAETGGSELVGPATELAKGTFYQEQLED